MRYGRAALLRRRAKNSRDRRGRYGKSEQRGQAGRSRGHGEEDRGSERKKRREEEKDSKGKESKRCLPKEAVDEAACKGLNLKRNSLEKTNGFGRRRTKNSHLDDVCRKKGFRKGEELTFISPVSMKSLRGKKPSSGRTVARERGVAGESRKGIQWKHG